LRASSTVRIAEREYAYDRESRVGKLDKAWDEAKAKGWAAVDMKQDWRTVLPDKHEFAARDLATTKRRKRNAESRKDRSRAVLSRVARGRANPVA
jgi:hypothetical protein